MSAKLLPGLDRPTYDKLDGMRKSILWEGVRSMAHLRMSMDAPKVATDAKNLGSAVHTLTLEPEKFDAEYVIAPKCDRRTKDGKATWEQFTNACADKTVLTIEQHREAVQMATALRRIDTLSDLLSLPGGLIESAIQWTDPVTGVVCKCRTDFCNPELETPVIFDIKTTVCADRRKFQSAAYEFGYHVQAAMYSDAVQILTHRTPVFLFFCVESAAPYLTKTYAMSDKALWVGQQKYRTLLAQYKQCVECGEWPGLSDDIDELDLPAWAEF